MVDAAFAKGRIQRLPQLLQRQIRGVEAGNGDLLQRFGQALQPVPFRQPFDGPKQFMARFTEPSTCRCTRRFSISITA